MEMLRTRHNRWNRNESFQRQKDKDKGYVRNVDVARVIFKDEAKILKLILSISFSISQIQRMDEILD